MLIKIKYSLIKYLICPFISILLFLLMWNVYKIANPSHQKQSIIRSGILSKLYEYSNKCQDDYWFTWLVVENNTISYEDLIGYNPNTDKINKVFSVKYAGLNPRHFEIHSIDLNTRVLIKLYDTGLVGYYDDIEVLKSYTRIYEEIKEANQNINKIVISVTKDKDKELIYVFTIAFSGKELSKCSKEDIINMSEWISIYAKKDL